MSVIDLHSHSTRSDGLLAPSALVVRAAERGVRTLALTDHDEVAGLDEARRHAGAARIELVNGVEISVTWEGQTLHVIGLHVDPQNAELRAGLEEIRKGRQARAGKIAAGLADAGIEGSLAGARSYATNPELVSRTHFARFLVKSGHARDVSSVFGRYLKPGKPGYVAHRWASLEHAMNWIKVSGGIPVLAHPGRYKLDAAQRDNLLARFTELGGAALEVVSGSHTPGEFDAWARHAQRFGLRASAGSDFHGPGESRCDLGDVPELPAGCRPVWEMF